jgi:hypothetical protein
LDSRVFQECSGLVNQGQDWFFKDWIGLIFQDWIGLIFQSWIRFSGFVFQGTIGLLDTGLVFLGNGCYDLLKDWIGRIGFFKGWNIFHGLRIKNGLSTFFQDIEFYAFPPFQRTAYIY